MSGQSVLKAPQEEQEAPKYNKTWFYQDEQGEHGPFDFRDFRYLALEKKILSDTPVWQTSDEERKMASEIQNLLPRAAKVADVKTGWDAQAERDPSPYQEPQRRTIMDGPPGGLYLPYLKTSHFSLLLAALLAGGGLSYASTFLLQEDSRLPVLCLAVAALVTAIVLASIYLHRAWEMLRVVGAPRTGKSAVLTMVLPLFNAFASFPVIFGWSGFWNYQVKTHPGFSTTTKVARPIFFLFCLSFLVSQILSLLVLAPLAFGIQPGVEISSHVLLWSWVTTGALGLLVWNAFCRKINFLATKKS